MAIVSGKDISATIDATDVDNLVSFEVEETVEMYSQAHSGSSGWKETVPGVKSWSGSLRVKAPDGKIQSEISTALDGPTAVALILTAASGATYSGDAYFASARLAAGVEDGIQHWDIPFTGSGELTKTSA